MGGVVSAGAVRRGTLRLSPTARAVGLVVLLPGALCVSPLRPYGAAIWGVIALLALRVAEVRAGTVGRRLLPVATLGVTLVGFRALAEALGYGTDDGRGEVFIASLVLKAYLVVALTTAAQPLLSERDVLVALNSLPMPSDARSIAYLMVRGVRYLRDEVLRLVRAREARGGGRGLRLLRALGSLAQVLIVRCGRRSETQAFALRARGFERGFPTVGLHRLRWSGWAVACAAVACAAMVARLPW